jgi:hypothetical protein
MSWLNFLGCQGPARRRSMAYISACAAKVARPEPRKSQPGTITGHAGLAAQRIAASYLWPSRSHGCPQHTNRNDYESGVRMSPLRFPETVGTRGLGFAAAPSIMVRRTRSRWSGMLSRNARRAGRAYLCDAVASLHDATPAVVAAMGLPWGFVPVRSPRSGEHRLCIRPLSHASEHRNVVATAAAAAMSERMREPQPPVGRRRTQEADLDEVEPARRVTPGPAKVTRSAGMAPARSALPSKHTLAEVDRAMHPSQALAYSQWLLSPDRAWSPVHRRATTDAAMPDPGALASAFGFLAEGSAVQGLPTDLALQLSTSLGVDASKIRLHTDLRAAAAADLLYARAFTIGYDIYFAAGAYDPTSESGLELIAHEVAHVAQHQHGEHGDATSAADVVSRPEDTHERQADELARRFVQRAANGWPPLPRGAPRHSPTTARTVGGVASPVHQRLQRFHRHQPRSQGSLRPRIPSPTTTRIATPSATTRGGAASPIPHRHRRQPRSQGGLRPRIRSPTTTRIATPSATTRGGAAARSARQSLIRCRILVLVR